MTDKPTLTVQNATEAFAQRLIDLGASSSEVVQALIAVAAGITLKDIGAERTKQYFADVALHLFDDDGD
ncbi:hypothetical protein ACPVPU_12625 [Sphingomonas sp. CJ99]